MGDKGGRCLGLTTFSLSRAYCLEIWERQFPGTARVCPVLYRDYFTFIQVTRTKYMTHGFYITVGNASYLHSSTKK